MTRTEQFPLSPPPLEELAEIVRPALESNYTESSISVSDCPDLRRAPFHLAAEGLSGRECIADIGGQPNLFPDPRLERNYSMITCARQMGMSQQRGMLIGAGAGPYFQLNTNAELAPNLSWQGAFNDVTNLTFFTKIDKETGGAICQRSSSMDCSLMMNLYGSTGLPGPVLRVTARGRKGSNKSFTECIRHALANHYGNERPISIGGVFAIKQGITKFHVMPDFPPKDPETHYTFNNAKQVTDWLTFHNFNTNSQSPIVCLTVFHSADPGKRMELRMEHTHCFTTDGSNRGGHYHYDLEGDDVEYEAYFNTAKVIYRIDKPEVTMERDA